MYERSENNFATKGKLLNPYYSKTDQSNSVPIEELP